MIFDLGAPGVPPRGCPKNLSSLEYIEFGVYRFVSMPTVQLKHSFGEPPLMGPGGAPKCPPGGAPKSKFLEIRQVWCLSLRLDAYCSAETFFWRTDPHGARGEPPKGTPNGTRNGAPPDFHRNTPLYGINRFVSMRTLNLQHRFEEPTLMGPGRAPKGHP